MLEETLIHVIFWGETMQNEVFDMAKQSTPPVAVTTFSLIGIQLSDWVYIFTLIYLFLQIIYLGRKLLRK